MGISHQPQSDNHTATEVSPSASTPAERADTVTQPVKVAQAEQIEVQSDAPTDLAITTDTHISDAMAQTGPTTDAIEAPVTDVWDRIRNGFSISYVDNARVQREVDWYQRHPAYLERVAERAEPYLYYITEQTESLGMPAEFALLPIVESAFQPFAYSHGRAAGIWQFIPGTGRLYGLKQNWWYDGRRDIYASTQAALRYLKSLHDEFNGDWLLALAAYNSGAGNVYKAIRKNHNRGKPVDFWSLDLPKETKSYVPRLIAIAEIVRHAEKYQIDLHEVDNEAYFAKVDIGKGQLDLALAAKMADISMDDLYLLNPGYNRWATSPNGPHYLIVPSDKAELFRERLASLDHDQRMRWKRHTIKNGETLGEIARKYHTTITQLRRSNRLHGNNIRAGKYLMIPVASKSLPSYTLSKAQRKRAILNSPKSGRIKLVHNVQQGDTWWDLARHYHVGVRSLAKWNASSPRDVLREGDKLVVWIKPGRNIKVSNQSVPAAPRHKPIIQRINYRVRIGDSLARIASKFKVRVRDLLKWNKLSVKSYLQPGQHIKLFVDITSQTGA